MAKNFGYEIEIRNKIVRKNEKTIARQLSMSLPGRCQKIKKLFILTAISQKILSHLFLALPLVVIPLN
jgi:hypothetical protein